MPQDISRGDPCTHRRHLLNLAAAAWVATLAAPAALGQADKPPLLRILVGFPPGGSADTIELANFQFCVVSGPKSNVKTMVELVARAKADPSTATCGASGNGTVPRFLGLMIGDAVGIDVEHGPFQGGAPAMTALMGGHIGCTMDVVTESLEQHRAGKLRVIEVAGAQRAPQLPEAPTLREQGVAMDASAWFARDGPGGLPAATALRLGTAVQAALKAPAFAQRLSAPGLEPIGATPEQLAAVQRTDLAKWAKPVKDSGFQADRGRCDGAPPQYRVQRR